MKTEKKETKIIEMNPNLKEQPTLSRAERRKIERDLSKKTEEPLTEEPLNADPSRQVYRKGVTADLDCNLFIGKILNFLSYVAMQERKDVVVLGENLQESKNNMQVQTSPMGLMALELSEEIYPYHIKNIRNGKTVEMEVLQKEYIEMVENKSKSKKNK